MNDLDICVCTYRRPQLSQTLASLNALRVPEGITPRILVIDNDDTSSAQAIVHAFAETSLIPVHYEYCPQGNISIARNGALDHSRSRYLAFIDDDEVATHDWLIHLFAAMAHNRADVALGPVQAVYAPCAPAWMQRLAIHETRPVWVNGTIKTGYTCNVLMDMHSAALRGRRFDLGLGQTGGEDHKFFSEAFAAGAQISYAEQAIVHEDVSHDRAAMSWLLKRRFRMGQTHGRILGREGGALATARHIAVAMAKVFYCLGAAALNGFSASRRNYSVLRATLHLGALSGLIGLRELRQYGAGFSPGPGN